jgi:hypothetical protein
MPPLDPASEDKHAPVKPAAARRPAVAPPSATAWRALINARERTAYETPLCPPKADKTLDCSEMSRSSKSRPAQARLIRPHVG